MDVRQWMSVSKVSKGDPVEVMQWRRSSEGDTMHVIPCML